MHNVIRLINEPWPWYISGPLLGLIVPFLLLFANKQLGVSSVLRHGCAMVRISKKEHFNYNWKNEKWNILFVLGILLAGVVVSNFFSFSLANLSDDATVYFNNKAITVSGYFPEELFNWSSSWSEFVIILVGGFLVGFGSRYSNGCTSGHAIMGLSKLKLGSLIAVIGFFVGGVLGTWFLIDNLL